MKRVGNYLLISNDNRILLDHKKQPLFAFSFENRILAERIANTISTLYGSDLGYLGYVEWLRGLQQIHQTMRDRYIFGDLVDQLTSLNRVVTALDVKQCTATIIQKYLMN